MQAVHGFPAVRGISLAIWRATRYDASPCNQLHNRA